MNLWISQKARNFLTSWLTATFSRGTVLHGSGYDLNLYIHSQWDGAGGTSLLLMSHTRQYHLFSRCTNISEHTYCIKTYPYNVTFSEKIFCANILYALKIKVFILASHILFSFRDSVGHKKILLILRGFLLSSTQQTSSKMCESYTICTRT
jgi:hypothetical protein